jgi:hypothetical protein
MSLCVSTCLYVYMSALLSLYVCMPISYASSLYVYMCMLCLCLYVYTCLYVYMSTCLYVCMGVCLYGYMSVICLYAYMCLYVYMSLRLYVYMSVCLYGYISLYICWSKSRHARRHTHAMHRSQNPWDRTRIKCNRTSTTVGLQYAKIGHMQLPKYIRTHAKQSNGTYVCECLLA